MKIPPPAEPFPSPEELRPMLVFLAKIRGLPGPTPELVEKIHGVVDALSPHGVPHCPPGGVERHGDVVDYIWRFPAASRTATLSIGATGPTLLEVKFHTPGEGTETIRVQFDQGEAPSKDCLLVWASLVDKDWKREIRAWKETEETKKCDGVPPSAETWTEDLARTAALGQAGHLCSWDDHVVVTDNINLPSQPRRFRVSLVPHATPLPSRDELVS